MISIPFHGTLPLIAAQFLVVLLYFLFPLGHLMYFVCPISESSTQIQNVTASASASASAPPNVVAPEFFSSPLTSSPSLPSPSPSDSANSLSEGLALSSFQDQYRIFKLMSAQLPNGLIPDESKAFLLVVLRCPSEPVKLPVVVELWDSDEQKIPLRVSISFRYHRVTLSSLSRVWNHEHNQLEEHQEFQKMSSLPSHLFKFKESAPQFTLEIQARSNGYNVIVDGYYSFFSSNFSSPSSIRYISLRGPCRLSTILAPQPLTDLSSPPAWPHSKFRPHNILHSHSHSEHVYRVFVGVLSSARNFEKRDSVRHSWMLYSQFKQEQIVLRFFVAQDKSDDINAQVLREQEEWGDLVILDFTESYYRVTRKTFAMCKFMLEDVNAEYLFKGDDDTFLRVPQLFAWLDSLSASSHSHPHRLVYAGYVLSDKAPIRAGSPEADDFPEWVVSEADYPASLFPDYCAGAGYLLSSELARAIAQKPDLNMFRFEDVAVGMWVKQIKEQNHWNVEYLNDAGFSPNFCTENMIFGHYVKPNQMKSIYNRDVSGEEPLCILDRTEIVYYND